MKKISIYKSKKVLVLGLARSGVSAASLLNDLGAIVTVNDVKPIEENLEAQKLVESGIRVIAGSHPVELMEEGFELVVKNPGIPYSNSMVMQALERRMPIITEVELAYEVSDAPIIGITGTNGKTTTTIMIASLLNAQRQSGQALLSGNIGFPASAVVQKTTSDDELVMELSSFQLMGIRKFQPEIAVITNLYAAHLDYHQTRDKYVNAKWQIQKNMTSENFLVINADQDELLALAATTKATMVPFSLKKEVDGAYFLDGSLFYKKEKIMSALELGTPGRHNIENALAAIAVAKLKGVSNDIICKELKQFHGVSHRMQFVVEVNGRKFYNDSKATNILATKMALSGFDNEKTILLAGGLDRGNDFNELIPELRNLKVLIVFGETAEKLIAAGKAAKVAHIQKTEKVESAVLLAYNLSKQGDSILLSPANASWDLYQNFEVRGEKFMEKVRELKEYIE
ncbi:MAG: UDP-N-acetylmuramoyl-L-alanine--D-glutamate ligase [Lactobacillales bacterium]|jgi:UDP-N-acetylmuramoylalanine--D-glutamate ligase|nr:UDP-N-acetylmuramoyl-L-alanine--D-glutamate ligase [Lactobacillales bacterium]